VDYLENEGRKPVPIRPYLLTNHAPCPAAQEAVIKRFMQSLGKDGRLAARHLLKLPPRLRKSQQCARSVQAENAWRRGVFFTTHIPMDEDTLVALFRRCRENFRSTGDVVAARGHMVRVESGETVNGARGVGVEFDFYVVSHTTTLKWESGPGIRGPIRA
jgi:hypothetical protein